MDEPTIEECAASMEAIGMSDGLPTVEGGDGVVRTFRQWCDEGDLLNGYADYPADAPEPRKAWRQGLTPRQAVFGLL